MDTARTCGSMGVYQGFEPSRAEAKMSGVLSPPVVPATVPHLCLPESQIQLTQMAALPGRGPEL